MIKFTKVIADAERADFYSSAHRAIRDLGLRDLYPIFIKHKVDSLETCGPLTDDQLIDLKAIGLHTRGADNDKFSFICA